MCPAYVHFLQMRRVLKVVCTVSSFPQSTGTSVKCNVGDLMEWFKVMFNSKEYLDT